MTQWSGSVARVSGYGLDTWADSMAPGSLEAFCRKGTPSSHGETFHSRLAGSPQDVGVSKKEHHPDEKKDHAPALSRNSEGPALPRTIGRLRTDGDEYLDSNSEKEEYSSRDEGEQSPSSEHARGSQVRNEYAALGPISGLSLELRRPLSRVVLIGPFKRRVRDSQTPIPLQGRPAPKDCRQPRFRSSGGSDRQNLGHRAGRTTWSGSVHQS